MHTHLLYNFVPNRRYAFTWTRLLTHICVTRPQRDNGDVKWLLWRLELPVNAVFVWQFAQIKNRETWKVHVTALCAGKPPVTSGFPAQRDSDTEILLFDDVTMSNLREKIWCCSSLTHTCVIRPHWMPITPNPNIFAGGTIINTWDIKLDGIIFDEAGIF